jgi:hypothetical protein
LRSEIFIVDLLIGCRRFIGIFGELLKCSQRRWGVGFQKTVTYQQFWKAEGFWPVYALLYITVIMGVAEIAQPFKSPHPYDPQRY